jgi:PAS domain S-box-containing protein
LTVFFRKVLLPTTLTALQRVLAVFGSAALILLLAPLLYSSVQRGEQRAVDVQLAHEVIHALSEVRERLVDAETGSRGFLITGNQAFLAPYHEAGQGARHAIAVLLVNVRDPAQRSDLVELEGLTERRLAIIDSVLELRRTSGLAAAVPQLERGREVMESARSLIAGMEERQRDIVAQRIESAYAQRRQAGVLGVLTLVAAAFLAFLTNLILTRHVAAREQAERELAAQNAALARQAEELETAVEQLQDQAMELETQAAELELQTEEQEAQNLQMEAQAANLDAQAEELRASNERLSAALSALSHSEERFRRISDSNMVGVLFWDVQGDITFANDAFLEMIGRSREDLEERRIDWRSITPPEYVPVDERAVAEIKARGVSRPFEKEYLRPDGTRVPVLLNAAAFSDRADHGVTLAVDLTERRRAEQELQDARQRLRLALDSARLGAWETDVAAGRTFWDVRAREILGVPGQEEVPIQAAISTIHEADRAHALQLFADVLAGRRDTYENEKRIIRPDGEVRWTSWTGLLRRDALTGEPVKLVGTVEDITEARAAREMLRHSEDRFRVITEAMPQIVWTASSDGNADWYNERWFDFTGLPRERGLGDGWRSVLHPDDEATTALAWYDALSSGGLYEIEHRVRAADGSFRWLLSRAVPLHDDNGHVVRWFGTATDIHEQKTAQVELQAARDAAEAASRAKSQFLAVISHELRTPLTAVIGYSDLLETGVLGELQEPQKLPLSRIRYSAWHLVELIDEILSFSRAEAGKEQVRLQVTDAADVVGSVVSLLEPEASRRGVRLNGHVPTPARVITDPGKLRQIVMNLVGNAVKFTDQGEVTVLLETSDGGSVTIRVHDTGPGIPQDQLEHIFEPFTQCDQEHTREKGGAGLGLAVSRRLARLLGGDVHVESVPGRGSTFSLTIPPPTAATVTEMIEA